MTPSCFNAVKHLYFHMCFLTGQYSLLKKDNQLRMLRIMCGLSLDVGMYSWARHSVICASFAHLQNTEWCWLSNFLFSRWFGEGGLQRNSQAMGVGSLGARAVLTFPSCSHLHSREGPRLSVLLFSGILSKICLGRIILLLKIKND